MRNPFAASLVAIAVCWAAFPRPVTGMQVPVAPGRPDVRTADENVHRLEFVATEREPRDDSSLRLRAYPGIGFPKMDAINDYVDWINRTSGGSVDDIDHYTSYGVALEHRLAENWYGGLAYQRFEADTDGTTYFMGRPLHFSLDLTVDGGEFYVRKTWPDVLGPLDLEGLLGIGYYVSDYRETEDGYRVSGHDSDFGFRAGLGVSGEVLKNVDLFVNAGYLWLKFDDYHRGGDDIRFVSPGSPQAEADFSGFWAGVGVTWRF